MTKGVGGAGKKKVNDVTKTTEDQEKLIYTKRETESETSERIYKYLGTDLTPRFYDGSYRHPTQTKDYMKGRRTSLSLKIFKGTILPPLHLLCFPTTVR